MCLCVCKMWHPNYLYLQMIDALSKFPTLSNTFFTFERKIISAINDTVI